MSTTRGHLAALGGPPDSGEHVERVATFEGARIELIHSGVLDAPLEYLQDHDEWVVVLEGSAQMDVAGERFEIRDGDWAVLPAGVIHRVVAVEPGTAWLAVHGSPAS